MPSNRPAASLKGTKDGLLITIGDADWSTVLAELAQQLERPGASAFFHGAKVQLDLGNRVVSPEELRTLSNVLEAHDLRIGIALDTPARERVESESGWSGGQPSENAPDALIIRRTLRSGQKVHHSGHVVVYGDVNDGAEVTAAGDVLVFGKLRGLIHAGAEGDDHATIGALLLAPPQLRIGKYIARAPEESKKKARGPEMAVVRDGRIVIESWRV